MRWNIIVECVGEDGKQSTITLGTIERLVGSTTTENLGVNLQESKQIANRLQDTVVKQQLQEHCEQTRKCLTCGKGGGDGFALAKISKVFLSVVMPVFGIPVRVTSST